MNFSTRAPRGSSEPGNHLLAFASEGTSRPDTIKTLSPETPLPPERRGRLVSFGRSIPIVAVILVLSTLAVLALRRVPMPQLTAASASRPGSLTIDTRPAGSEVWIDGERRGATPVTLALAPGPHTLTIRNGSDERVVPLTIAAGAEVNHYFDLNPTNAAALGGLSVTTDPPGALVSVDGKRRGVSPLTVGNLTTDDHKVAITTDTGIVERIVPVTAGSTASVMFSLPKISGPIGGWLSIAAPFELEVIEREDVIGTSEMSRIMLASGRHEIVLRNVELGYSEQRTIAVTAGKTVSLQVDPPKARVSVNARPWAEIILDGSGVGQTPIANLEVAIGSHEVVFRHPTLGERKQTIVVRATGSNRIAADLTK
jgi:hypothetical protein